MSTTSIKPTVARRLVRAAETAAEMRAAGQIGPIAYLHTIMCQCSMPYRDPGSEVREWTRINGNALLELSAGKAMNPITHALEEIGLPHGSKPRLLLAHLNAEAIRLQKPVVPLGNGIRDYTRRLAIDDNGRNTNLIKDQLTRLAAASIRLGMVTNGRAVTINTNVVSAFDLWDDGNERQTTMWPSTIRLGTDYFESLMVHAVPLYEPALKALANSPMALDVYAWLAQRLHRIPQGKPYTLSWGGLKDQFGEGYTRLRDFRRYFSPTLEGVVTQYPDARVELDPEAGLTMFKSLPPVLPKTTTTVILPSG